MTNTNQLKACMIREGISQERLAELIGISQTSLSYKVNNKRKFDAVEIKAIKDALHLTPEERDAIFFGEWVDNMTTEIERKRKCN